MLFQLNKLGNQGNNEGNLTLTQASGEAFPVWNTVFAENKVSRLSISGGTVQPGTPAPDAPVEFQSVGDSGLILTVASAREGGSVQTFSFGNIVLRSLPNGVRDEIVYEAGLWKYIQRVGVYTIPSTQSVEWGSGYNAETGKVVFGLYQLPLASKTELFYASKTNLLSNRFMRSQANSTVPTNSGEFATGHNGRFNYVTFALSPEVLSETPDEGLTNRNKTLIRNWLKENETVILYPIGEPIETVLDLTTIPTFPGETWFMTNQAEVKPRMSAQIKVRKSEEYVKDGMLLWARFDDKTNSDADRGTVNDLSGNGNDFQLKNFAFMPGSGYEDGCLKFDGVDDFLMGENKDIGTVQITVKDVNPQKISSPQKYIFGGYDTTHENVIGVSAYPARIGGVNMREYVNEIIALAPFQTIFFRTIDSIAHQFESCVGAYRNITNYCTEMNLYEVVLYSTVLTAEQVQHNQKVSQQRNGVENLHGVDIPVSKDLLGWWDVSGKTNADSQRTVITDQSGNGYNFSLTGFGYIPGSGFNNGILEFDGVDDLATLTLPALDRNEKTIFMVLAPMVAPSASIRAYTFLGAEICSLTPSGILQFLSDSSTGYSLIQSPVRYYDYSKPHIICFSRAGNNARGYLDGNLTGENSNFRDKPWAQYFYIGGVATAKYPLNFFAAVLYTRTLSDQEIQQTTNFLKQKYGI